MNKALEKKLETIPSDPGVYFHKNSNGEIIYVGKAAVLKNRIRQYFHKSRVRDAKTDALVSEIADTDWIIVADEVEALFLEAEMIRRYQPQYNILLRDDKSVAYVRIDSKSRAPSVTITRRPLDDKADYYGPFLQTLPLRRSLKYLRKIFPYSTHHTLPNRGCLQYHLGLCPGPETENYSEKDYKDNLKKLSLYLKGQRVALITQLEQEMNLAADNKAYEEAAKKRNTITALKSLRARIIFSDRENLDLSNDHALFDFATLLGLATPPKRIEGYDISHMSGTDTVASMVVFTNGIADKGAYRKFKMRIPGNDDFAHMEEVIARRLKKSSQKTWQLPDIFLIDGGKGQLAAALKARNAAGLTIPMIGLAKKYEEIVLHTKKSYVSVNLEKLHQLQGYITDTSDDFQVLDLPNTAHLIKLLQRIRDESHRFAVSYHSTLKISRQRESQLDTIPGIGPITKRTLLKKFGSLAGIANATLDEIASAVGSKKAHLIMSYIKKEE
ncbi:excinuclease ABC subunit UvrC [Candidatus Saccharibacteria bacterium]|nr:excinuclease ABC subunit UvrC [Candidatus Saccharibacteria bacterium]MCB9817501.1 excinuclease ABC subunit UvrC [Candidatus Nomurabacteria bacterium]HPD98911.1 excinuclease ABC subunit UvrC [Candidatus Saccharibacteria bacterium]